MRAVQLRKMPVPMLSTRAGRTRVVRAAQAANTPTPSERRESGRCTCCKNRQLLNKASPRVVKLEQPERSTLMRELQLPSGPALFASMLSLPKVTSRGSRMSSRTVPSPNGSSPRCCRPTSQNRHCKAHSSEARSSVKSSLMCVCYLYCPVEHCPSCTSRDHGPQHLPTLHSSHERVNPC